VCSEHLPAVVRGFFLRKMPNGIILDNNRGSDVVSLLSVLARDILHCRSLHELCSGVLSSELRSYFVLKRMSGFLIFFGSSIQLHVVHRRYRKPRSCCRLTSIFVGVI
jgi:hypothetical protein